MARPDGLLAVVLVLSQLLYLGTVSLLGVRLTLLARRNRQLPECLLAIHFTLCALIGYLLLGIAMPAAYGPDPLPAIAMVPMVSIGHLFSCIGVFAGAYFNYYVFRRSQAWARLLLLAFGAALAVGYVGYGVAGGFRTGLIEGVWYWLMYGGYSAVAAWVMVEPLWHYFSGMRRRVRLGLADPLLGNRFLLWGCGSVCRFAMLLMGALPMMLREQIDPERWNEIVTLTLSGVAIAGFGVSVAYWLTFFPTEAYKRFVARNTRSDSTA